MNEQRWFRSARRLVGCCLGVSWAAAATASEGLAPTSRAPAVSAAFTQVAPPPGASGLMPPPPPPSPESTQTLRQLEQAEREDSGRGLEFVWLEPEVGLQWMSLTALKNGGFADDSLDTAGIGAALGAGAGLRLLYLTAGARFRYLLLSPFQLWSLGFEAALRIPKGRWEPYAALAVGYASAARFSAGHATTAAPDLSAKGLSTRVGGGIDYYVTPVFSAGLRADVELLFLWRDSIAGASSGSTYATDGSAIGLGASASAVLGLHF